MWKAAIADNGHQMAECRAELIIVWAELICGREAGGAWGSRDAPRKHQAGGPGPL